tara:strand:- start:234 stop:1709 length:1476 start_codon:yes stop_codon:yes gene_type:complete
MAPLGAGKALYLNLTNSEASGQWNNTLPTTSVFTLDTDSNDNGSGNAHIAYSFTSKAGYSKVGTYTGNGGENIVETGFEPAFLLTKSVTATGQWIIWDNKRNPSNRRNSGLFPNTSSVEYAYPDTASGPGGPAFYANGFSFDNNDSDYNGNGITYSYLAIAADGSTSTPTLANSFATETYTGNSGTQSITTGFKPGFVWMKGRNYADAPGLFDSIRGTNFYLATSLTAAQGGQASYNTLTSFDNNGFTLGNDVTERINLSGKTYVSWSWKAGGIPTINTDGAITSIVSANQAAGFSIVKWKTSTSLATVGHGLGYSPELIIGKGINWDSSWPVYVLPVGNNKKMSLNAQPGATTSTIWGNTTPTATTFNQDFTGTANRTSIAYCWRSITGYSKVGSYTGTGNAGQIIPTGFSPSWVLIKSTVGDDNWRIFDTTRGITSGGILEPNSSASENTSNAPGIAMTGTSFEITSGGVSIGLNANNNLYIYLAIKEN